MPVSNDLEHLYDVHAQAIFSFLLNFTRSEEETREVIQEIFCKLAARSDLLKDVREERSFLLRLARNLAIDLMRRRATRLRNYEEFGSEPVQLFDHNIQSDEQNYRKAVSAALAELPLEQREVTHLKLWEGFTFEEIAKTLGISSNTAASRYRYGIDKLRQRLRPIYEEL